MHIIHFCCCRSCRRGNYAVKNTSSFDTLYTDNINRYLQDAAENVYNELFVECEEGKFLLNEYFNVWKS